MRAGTFSRSSCSLIATCNASPLRRDSSCRSTRTKHCSPAWHGRKCRIQVHLEGKSSANNHRSAAVREERRGINKENTKVTTFLAYRGLVQIIVSAQRLL